MTTAFAREGATPDSYGLPAITDFRIKTPMRDTPADPPLAVPSNYSRYIDLYDLETRLNITSAALLEDMSQHGVTNGILQAEHEWGDDTVWNDRTADLLRRHPGNFLCGFATVDPREGMAAVREVDRAYHDLGLSGVVFEPGFLDLSPIDPRCYPIYAKCVEIGIPVGLHTGINFSSHGTIAHGRPILVDQIACHFPELIIICHHGGWPWPHEAAAVAWKHRNVYLEFGAISPRYMAGGAGGGWGDIAHLMDTVLHDRVLFGTDWPVIRYERALPELSCLNLRPASLEAYLSGNAMRLLDRIHSAPHRR